MYQLLIFLALVGLVYWLLIRGRGSSQEMGHRTNTLRERLANEYQCSTCIHCVSMDRDGVMCSFRGRTVFKTPVHVANCTDHEAPKMMDS